MKRPLVAVAVLAIASCAEHGSDPGALGQELKVAYGQQITISEEALTIAFTEVNEESRCPTDAQCPWAGQATVTLTIKKGDSASEPRTVTIPGAETATYMNYAITLLELAPYPSVNHQPALEEYEATLVVEKP